MQIITPVTDYIPASTLTTNRDMVVRDSGAVTRIALDTAFYAKNSVSQGIPSGGMELVEFNQENFDIGGHFDTGNHKFVVPRTGYYFLAAQVMFLACADNKSMRLFILEEANPIFTMDIRTSGAGTALSIHTSGIAHLTADNDIKVYVTNGDTVARNITGDDQSTFFQGFILPFL